MRLSTRLLLLLLPTVTLVMVGYASWAVIERENTLVPEARQEVSAYATALGLAFELAFREVRREDVQALLNEITRAPTLYGILVYDSTGARTIFSDPLRTPSSADAPILKRVLTTGVTATFEREIEGERVFSVLRALRNPAGRITGALEVAEPLQSIEAGKARALQRFLLNTLTLLAALSLVTLWLVRRVVAKPMARLVTAARALGRGELTHRINEDARGGELSELARELNGMAENLEMARLAAAREAEDRVALERRVRAAEKMAAIGNLAAGLAHEIAAPLNVISGRAEIMRTRDPDPPARERNLGIIVQQINRITTIVRNLLDFAKRQELRIRDLDLGELVEDALEFLDTELARAGITVRREQTGPVWIRGDPDLLHQVLVNLLLNAHQAMEGLDGPRDITIRLSPDAGTARDDPAGYAVVEVEDSGPGIPMEMLASVFEPFFTTKPRGTGLGLVVARQIVEEHGGRLEAQSSSRGARFRMTIPRATPGTAGPTHG